MTVTSELSRKTYAGNDVTTSFGTSPMVFFDSADLTVYVVTTATGAVVATLVENTDYTVTGGDGSTGTLNLAAGSDPYGAPATGTTLVIVRDVAATQESDFVNNDPSDAEVVEDALDRLTMIDQQQSTLVARALRLPDSDVSAGDTELPVVGDRASKVIGFDASGDLTMYDPASAVTTAGSVTFTQSGAGAVATDLDERGRVTVYLKADFGATGDGTTDDTAAVTAWLARIAGGDKGYAEAGTYVVEACPVLSNTDIDGAGQGSAVFKLKTAAATPQILKTTTSRSNITIRNVGFDCNGVTSGVALHLSGVTGAKVEGCRFTSKYGVYLIGTCDDIQIKGNTFGANNYAVITESSSATSNVSVVGNTFKGCTSDGVEINCPTGSALNWVVSGNTFDTIGGDAGANKGFGVGASGGTSYIDGLAINGNTFRRCDHQAVHIEDGCKNVTISGNTIVEPGYGSTETYLAGIYISGAVALNRAVSNVVVVGNTIVGGADMDYGIFCAGSYAMTGMVIRGNVISGHLLYGVFTGSVVNGFNISGNIIYNGAGPGIRASASSGVYSENVCFDNQGVPTQTYGIEINTGSDAAFIGNILKDNVTGAFLITAAGTRNRFVGNIESAAGTTTHAGLGVGVEVGGQVVFPATQNASSDANTLDDYEEGTWTPVLTFTTPGDISVTYSAQVGSYTKVGRLVTLNFNITTSAFTHTTASGELRVTGSPFAPAGTTSYQWVGAVQWSGITKANYTDVVARLVAGVSQIAFPISGSGQGTTAVAAADMPTGGTVILRGTITYHV